MKAKAVHVRRKALTSLDDMRFLILCRISGSSLCCIEVATLNAFCLEHAISLEVLYASPALARSQCCCIA